MGIEEYYFNIYLYTVVILTVIVAVVMGQKNFAQIAYKRHGILLAVLLGVGFAWFLGQRPTDGFLFGDSYLYKHIFNLHVRGLVSSSMEISQEFLWVEFTRYCADHVTLSTYFTIIAGTYFGFALLASYKFTPNNTLITFLFLLGSISMYTYAVNGLRNGVACNVVLLAIAFMIQKKRKLLIVLFLSLFAFNIHKSAILPLMSLFVSVYCLKSFKAAYTCWIIAVLLSLVAGGLFGQIFASLGFDERATKYMSTIHSSKFSHLGFRWDFLIYSMMPIMLGYYVVIKRGIRDRSYEILLNTYTLANAFWVLVIRASYSNRFAYLSWFMYPIVLAYPLLKLDIWGDKQGLRLRQIMLAHIGFTWFMFTFYW